MGAAFGAFAYLAPLAGRGRRRRMAASPGEGILRESSFAESPLTPTLSPQAGRGSRQDRPE
jgi:hypothetical protein